jgi:hypothetical protein
MMCQADDPYLRKSAMLAACVWIAAFLPLAVGQGSASPPGVKLTCLNRDETISRHARYPITWTAENIQANTMLSIRVDWTTQDSGFQVGGVPQKAETSWLIGALLDSATQKRFAALSASATEFPTIESGKYFWDVDKFCKQNRQGNKSVCSSDAHYRLQVILRSADDPCADSFPCRKPRSLFRVHMSDGTFSFRD